MVWGSVGSRGLQGFPVVKGDSARQHDPVCNLALAQELVRGRVCLGFRVRV